MSSSVGKCSVSPIGTHDGSSCVLGTTYGCTEGESKMWVVAPCHGHFTCDGYELYCHSSRVTEKPGRRHHCACFDFEERVQSTGAMRRGSLPPSLSIARLVEGSIHEARFVPKTTDEIMHATFTFWNILDRVMLESSHSNYQTGYVREMQVRRMVQLVTAPGVRTYCEVGMNGGHSASAMLLANPSLIVHSFDIMHWPYSPRVSQLLSTAFGSRFVPHPGNSRETIPQWSAKIAAEQGASSRAAPCDMLLVDGDHSLAGALADLRNFRPLAASGAPIIVDDIATAPGGAVQSLEKSGVLLVRETYGPYDAPSRFNSCMRTINRGAMCLPWGFTVAQYAPDKERAAAAGG